MDEASWNGTSGEVIDHSGNNNHGVSATNDSGTSSGSNTSTTLNDTSKSWTTNIFADHNVAITGGTGSGQTRTISGNTATELTVSSAWTTTPDATSTYHITGTTEAGKFGNGGNFDGADDYVNIGSPTVLDDMYELTYSAWIYPTADGDRDMLSKADYYKEFRLAGTSPNMYLRVCAASTLSENSACSNSSAGSITLNTWQHVTATYNHNGDQIARLYINGQEVSYSLQEKFEGALESDASGDLNLGRRGNGSRYFSGSIDEVRIYNRALTPAEVQSLYKWAPGPVGYWKFDEGTGTTAYDSSGNSNSGTLTNGPQWASGKMGGALNFNGNNNYISISDSASTKNFTALTVTAWINFPDNSTGGTQRTIISKGLLNNYDYTFRVQLNTNTLLFGLNNDTMYSITSSSIPNNQWVHASATYDGSSISIYINGQEVTSNNTGSISSINSSTSITAIGRAASNSAQYFNGLIDDVKIYNYARTPEQIIQDMNAGHPAPGSPVGSASVHYKFDEGYGTTANNSGNGGSALNGTIANGTWTNEGKFGRALTYASNTSVTRTITDPGNTNTLSVWVYPTTSAASKTLVTASRLTTDSSSRPVFGGCTGTALPLDTWTHIVAVSDGASSCAIYQNGTRTATGTTGVTFGTSLNLGASSFTGRMDEFKLYYLGMSADQVKAEFNQGVQTVFGATKDETGQTTHAASADYCPPGQTTACVGPIAHWKFDEKSGTTANDSSGNNNQGTLTDAQPANSDGNTPPQWTRGVIGQGLTFDGTDDYIALGASSTFFTSTDTQATLSFWSKDTATDTDIRRLFVLRGSSDSDIRMGFGTRNAGRYLSVDYRDGSGTPQTLGDTTTALSDGKWHHTKLVIDNSNISIYLDGRLLATASNFSPTNSLNGGTETARIGMQYGGFNWQGLMDDVKVFNYARTPAQIAWDFNRGKPQWHLMLNQTEGTTAFDSGPLSINGTLQGNAVFNTTAGQCKFGHCVDLDGTDDYISTGNLLPLAASGITTNKASWGGWYYLNTSGASKALLEKASELRLTTNANSKAVCDIYTGGTFTSNSAASSNQALPLNSWNHVLCTYDGTNIRLYVNGELADSWSQTGNITAANSAAYIGSSSGGTGDVSGRIDEQYIFNYPLTPIQVKQYVNQGAAVRF
jgi:hypothetical protein